jgi:aspartyl protease family protein
MMTNDLMLGGVYILMAVMLVIGSLMSRREPAAKLITIALAWIAIFAAGFVLFTFRDNFGWVAQRLKAEAVGTPVQEGRETRIPMAIDGHFWVEGRLNGEKVKFLVDSGATMTTIDRETAARAGVAVSPQRDQFVRTGNGIIRVSSARADELEVGGIRRQDVGLQVADNDDLNVLGMNFLSSLQSWGVQGRWLVLVP